MKAGQWYSIYLPQRDGRLSVYVCGITEQMSFSVRCKRLEVMLVRDAGGTFGMTLRGGASVDPGKCRPLTVTHIRPAGPADRLTF